MQVAVISPWYVANGGAEKVDGAFGDLYPEATFHALFFNEGGIPSGLRGRTIETSWLQSIPAIEKLYRPLLAAFPFAIESIDLRGFDLVISSDWACVKGVLTDLGTLHVCYCHTPMRHVWDLYRNYLLDAPRWQRPIFAWSAHHLRQWDYQCAQRVEYFIANSRYIQDRIRKYYRRESTVIYPPVETGRGYLSERPDTYYLSVGRLNRTKRLDLIIQACNRLGRRLLISGWGPEERRLKAMAGPTVEFLGRVPDTQLPSLYANCRALLFAANEDFGIVPVEAQSYGRPVIAFGFGGSLETVRSNDQDGRSDTGLFFMEQRVESVVHAIQLFESREDSFIPKDIQEHAREFDTAKFKRKFREFIDAAVHKRDNGGR